MHMRITKKEFYARGGLRNSNLFRRMRGGKWQYYIKSWSNPAGGKKISAAQIRMGIKVELEHTKSRKRARKIAMDHLHETPNYYTRLRKCFPGEHNPIFKKKLRAVGKKTLRRNPVMTIVDPKGIESVGINPRKVFGKARLVKERVPFKKSRYVWVVPESITGAKARKIIGSGVGGVVVGPNRVMDLQTGEVYEDTRFPEGNPPKGKEVKKTYMSKGYAHKVFIPNWKRSIDKRSIRTKTIRKKDGGKRLLRIGCPKGQWMPRAQKCKVGMKAISILTPKAEKILALPSRKEYALFAVGNNPGRAGHSSLSALPRDVEGRTIIPQHPSGEHNKWLRIIAQASITGMRIMGLDREQMMANIAKDYVFQYPEESLAKIKQMLPQGPLQNRNPMGGKSGLLFPLEPSGPRQIAQNPRRKSWTKWPLIDRKQVPSRCHRCGRVASYFHNQRWACAAHGPEWARANNPRRRGRNDEKEMEYKPGMRIRNLQALPRGLGAKYLIVIPAPESDPGAWVAKRWAREKPMLTGIEHLLVMKRA